ncbi:MAG: O-methyltransferase [Bacteroidia bacterium]|nr:MAG: O-methyltransferase [Bacteroidia bacterium]
MKEPIEQYILDHITEEPQLLKELYLDTHRRVVNPNMISGHIQGRLLNMLVKMINPVSVLEIGTYTGYSAICIASALQAGARLHTIERNDELIEISSEYILRSGLSGRIVQHAGDAREIIPVIEGFFDLVFIDGDKREYNEYYDLVFDRVAGGGYIIADNVLWDGKVADSEADDPMTTGIRKFNHRIKNDPRVENTIIPLRDGLMLTRKL